MNLSIAIIGLPNVGKSTLFNALLKKQSTFAEASAGQAGSGIARVGNYPFTTIEPNVGIVPVPDDRLEKLAEITKEEEGMQNLPPIKPAIVKFIDIAGLVKGASQGEGLGNKFLSHIREADIICHVQRYFKDPNIVHVSDEPKPQNYKITINTELILADLETLIKQLPPRKTTKEDRIRWQVIVTLRNELNNGILAKDVKLTEEEKEMAKNLNLITAKPTFFIANVGEEDLKKDFGKDTIAVSAKTEAELAELSAGEQREYLNSLGLKQSGLERVIEKGYEMLGLISFLTAGEKEVRAWTIEKDMNAVDAAGVIHTDFSKKFIKAEIAAYHEFVENNGWRGSRANGKTRFEGRDYIMHDGDVVEFKIGS